MRSWTRPSIAVNIDIDESPPHTVRMPLDLIPVSTPAACCTPATSAAISEQDAAQLARTLKALADPARLRLLSLIAAHDGGEACVCDLIEPVGLAQPTVSHHLKVLTDAGLITREKRGVWAYFTLVPGALEAVTRHLDAHLTGSVRTWGSAERDLMPD
jgi:ArsR family transcriptional regulator, arsenate/arsenite/antimonite-responsive transcriptional repressor